MSDLITGIPPANQVVTNRQIVVRAPAVGGRGQLAASSGTLYTAPSTTTPIGNIARSVLTGIVFCNTDSSARTVTIYLIESGGSVADNRAILKAVSIPANTTWIAEFGTFGIPLDNAETVRGLASVASVVTYRINVEEYN